MQIIMSMCACVVYPQLYITKIDDSLIGERCFLVNLVLKKAHTHACTIQMIASWRMHFPQNSSTEHQKCSELWRSAALSHHDAVKPDLAMTAFSFYQKGYVDFRSPGLVNNFKMKVIHQISQINEHNYTSLPQNALEAFATRLFLIKVLRKLLTDLRFPRNDSFEKSCTDSISESFQIQTRQDFLHSLFNHHCNVVPSPYSTARKNENTSCLLCNKQNCHC